MRRGLLIGLAVVTGLVVGWATFERYHQNRVFQGVEAAGVAVGGLTLEEATGRIAAATQTAAPPQLTLKAGDKTLQVSAAELGWKPDPAATAERAFAVGRDSFAERIAALRGQVEVPLVPSVDAAALERRLQAIAKSLEYAPTDARVVFRGGQYAVTPDKNGLRLDVQSAIQTYLERPDQTALEFFPKSVAPAVTAAMLEPVAAKANSLLRPLALTYIEPDLPGGGQIRRRTLSTGDIAGLLSVRDGVAVNPEALARLVAQVARRFDRQPVDARYAMTRDGQLTVRPEVEGWRMNQPQARRQLEAELLRPDLTELSLPVAARTAAVRAADLPKVESLQLLAEATTYYAGSAGERIANVHAAARNLDGYIVPAGGVFNFNNAIGSISPENGFMEALVISGGRTVKGVGGGVCQVSTTAFRAIYQAGLPIVERNQHAYRVRWYDNVVGFDAAVYQPYLNLRAQNDTPGPLVVRSTVTRTTHTVRIYGVPDGRRVSVSRPAILARTPHPPAQYVVEPTLRAGQVKQVDWAVDGFRTRIVRTVARPDGRVETHVLNSNFRPWRSVYQVGPGTPIPGQEVASR